eukprot:CAMPEP_0181169972 /NCGR_PEP_ID=MMETSP1096-20121128/1107_1 /TAXON_ID=156174 ORGANISM="Chrysochromulina ericina, Strain CCMP281" /NCGR_SAMPLE_ID=MMETSP1096 /ASSEMBLY_ACC=CAM_ASM_000453 /LENGTH=113 /DNA_ID=CAMNT_0023257481 /DNA_START=223 /DNA_END=565 /DNA_ORIENTATION=+
MARALASGKAALNQHNPAQLTQHSALFGLRAYSQFSCSSSDHCASCSSSNAKRCCEQPLTTRSATTSQYAMSQAAHVTLSLAPTIGMAQTAALDRSAVCAAAGGRRRTGRSLP